MVRIGISGVCGRMGRRILHIVQAGKDARATVGLEREGHPDVGKCIDGLGVSSDITKIRECDCLIEFTTPQVTTEHLKAVIEFKKAVVIGTTGLTQQQQDEVKEAARQVPVVYAPNMSVGVNLLFELVRAAAEILKNYAVSVEEAHHIHKKDAPSGTAKKIAEILNREGFKLPIEDIKAVREDEIVGDHRVVFESSTDKLELFHSAKTRDIFAEGAVRAGCWVVSKPAGLYSMRDVLCEGSRKQ